MDKGRKFTITCALLLVLALALLWIRAGDRAPPSERESRAQLPNSQVTASPRESSDSLEAQGSARPENSLADEHPTVRNQLRLREAMRRDSEGLVLEEYPDGRRSVHLSGRFLHMSVAFRGEDGQLIRRCYNEYEAMEQAGEAFVERRTNSSRQPEASISAVR